MGKKLIGEIIQICFQGKKRGQKICSYFLTPSQWKIYERGHNEWWQLFHLLVQPGVKPLGELSWSSHFLPDPILKKRKLKQGKKSSKITFILNSSKMFLITHLKCVITCIICNISYPLIVWTIENINIRSLGRKK